MLVVWIKGRFDEKWLNSGYILFADLMNSVKEAERIFLPWAYGRISEIIKLWEEQVLILRGETKSLVWEYWYAWSRHKNVFGG